MYVTHAQNFDFISNLPMSGARTTCLHEKLLKPGAHLFREGDQVKWLYQVKTGVLRLTRLMEDGRRLVIAFGYPGDIVGFPASEKHHTDCDALTDTCVQPYRVADLDTGINDAPLHQALVTAALGEISAMQDHFMMLGRKSASEKIASFLSVLTTHYGNDIGQYRSVHLPMSRGDIADFLGLTTETVSRALSQLRKGKVIALDHITTVIVLRPDALATLANTSVS